MSIAEPETRYRNDVGFPRTGPEVDAAAEAFEDAARGKELPCVDPLAGGMVTPGMLPEDWTDDTGMAKEAAGWCRNACPAIEACLQLALVRGERHGVWGGLTSAERAKLARAALKRRRDEVRGSQALPGMEMVSSYR